MIDFLWLGEVVIFDKMVDDTMPFGVDAIQFENIEKATNYLIEHDYDQGYINAFIVFPPVNHIVYLN